jgi:putative membrane protein
MVTTKIDWPSWATGAMGGDGAERIEAAIAAAESRTSGEIVPVLVRRSSTVRHVPMLGFLLILVCLLLIDLPRLLETLGGPHWAWLAACWIGAAAIGIGIGRFDAIQRLLTSRFDQSQQVEMRAEVEFYEQSIGQTRHSTGILLFISLMEHRAVVLADRAIAERLDPGVWQAVVDLMVGGVKRGDLAAGFVEAIGRCGELLAADFPIRADDTNELRNHLVVKE